jgi:voltage-gated potassium channel
MSETRGLIRSRTQRAVANRRVFPFLALMTLLVALGAGFVVTIIDKEDFPDFGTAVWWAIVTLGTVGYGDVVPHTGWGRLVGSVVIIFGVTFIAFLTAVVTSLFVEAEQEGHRQRADDAQRAAHDETRQLLHDVSDRLAAVEAMLRKIDGASR